MIQDVLRESRKHQLAVLTIPVGTGVHVFEECPVNSTFF